MSEQVPYVKDHVSSFAIEIITNHRYVIFKSGGGIEMLVFKSHYLKSACTTT